MNTYSSGDKFNLGNTVYRIKTAKEKATAVEVASHEGQSLWVSVEELERLLKESGN